MSSTFLLFVFHLQFVQDELKEEKCGGEMFTRQCRPEPGTSTEMFQRMKGGNLVTDSMSRKKYSRVYRSGVQQETDMVWGGQHLVRIERRANLVHCVIILKFLQTVPPLVPVQQHRLFPLSLASCPLRRSKAVNEVSQIQAQRPGARGCF